MAEDFFKSVAYVIKRLRPLNLTWPNLPGVPSRDIGDCIRYLVWFNRFENFTLKEFGFNTLTAYESLEDQRSWERVLNYVPAAIAGDYYKTILSDRTFQAAAAKVYDIDNELTMNWGIPLPGDIFFPISDFISLIKSMIIDLFRHQFNTKTSCVRTCLKDSVQEFTPMCTMLLPAVLRAIWSSNEQHITSMLKDWKVEPTARFIKAVVFELPRCISKAELFRDVTTFSLYAHGVSMIHTNKNETNFEPCLTHETVEAVLSAVLVQMPDEPMDNILLRLAKPPSPYYDFAAKLLSLMLSYTCTTPQERDTFNIRDLIKKMFETRTEENKNFLFTDMFGLLFNSDYESTKKILLTLWNRALKPSAFHFPGFKEALPYTHAAAAGAPVHYSLFK